MKIINHKFTDTIYKPSPNHGGEIVPDTVVVHYTSTHSTKPAIHTLCSPEAKVSAHLVIRRDGNLNQLIPFNIKAWHAGKSELDGRKSLNNFSIGIELVNAGKLTDDKKTWYRHQIQDDDCVKIGGVWWHRYPEEQVESLYKVCHLLYDKYNLLDIVGHSDIAPGRKIDPGPALDLEQLRDSVFSWQDWE